MRRISKGVEQAYADASYTFNKDKVTYALGKGASREMKLKPDSKRADVFTIEQENTKVSAPRYFFKIEKGELYLMPVTLAAKGKDKPDFSGNQAPVVVFKKVN